MGDIGRKQREVEFEPLDVPYTAPADPAPAPATPAPVVVPEQEPVPA
jgi:hypothetical protein